MPPTSKFIKDLKKTELNELAQLTSLPNYSSMKKDDLGVALEDHLKRNASIYSTNPRLSGYFGTSSSTSPAKKATENVAQRVHDIMTGDSENSLQVKKQRRKTTANTDESGPADATALTKTPAPKDIERRKSSSILGSQSPALSPQIITNAWDKGKRTVTDTVTEFYEKSGFTEWAEWAREGLSSPAAIAVLATSFEAYGLRAGILPAKRVGQTYAIPAIKLDKTDLNLPDIFLILEPTKFWAPFFLWLLTSIFLPAAVSYFINLPLRNEASHGYGTRRASAQKAPSNDIFFFNIAKGLICYLVYAEHFQFFGLFSNYTIATVNESIYAGYRSMLTGAGIGAAASLYEAVLRK